MHRRRTLAAFAVAEHAIRDAPGVLDTFGPADLAHTAAVQGASARNAAEMVLSLTSGRTAGQIIVVPRTFATHGSPLYPRLQRIARELTHAIGGKAGVTGTGARLIDYDTTISARFPLLIIALALAGFLALVAILRAPLLALIAALANALAVAAAFAAIALSFQGHHPLLGGAGFVDVSAAAGMFAVIFGLSMDYQVFLLARIHERRIDHDANGALDAALGDTAAVVTGAATIMTAVFAAFAAAPFVSLRQLGVGLAAAVLVDATLIRLVFFPATLQLLGERAWWKPSWLRAGVRTLVPLDGSTSVSLRA